MNYELNESFHIADNCCMHGLNVWCGVWRKKFGINLGQVQSMTVMARYIVQEQGDFF